VLLHVVDASAADPAIDYLAVREELRMYNPDYCNRPHVVALNKMDMEDAGALKQEIAHEVLAVATSLMQQHPGESSTPVAVVACSALTGEGVKDLATALQRVVGGPDSVVLGHEQDSAIHVVHRPVVEEDVGGNDVWIALKGDASDDATEGPAIDVICQHVDGTTGDVDSEAEEGEEPPPPLDPNDPDTWLFNLTDEELLALEESGDHDDARIS